MGDRLVILAGGLSSRMKQAAATENVDAWLIREADEKPKSMMSIGADKRPFLDYLLYNARSAGYSDIVLVIGERDATARSYYGGADRGNYFHGLSISYAVQRIPEGRTKPLGTADALLTALTAMPEWGGKCFTVCNSDNLYSIDAFTVMRMFTESGGVIDYDRDALGLAADRVALFAVIKKNTEGFLESIVERPSNAEVDSCRSASGRVGVSMNIFRFRFDSILPFLQTVPEHPVRREKELPEAVRLLVQSHPREMLTVELAEPVPDLTSKDDIGRMRELLARTFPAALWE